MAHHKTHQYHAPILPLEPPDETNETGECIEEENTQENSIFTGDISPLMLLQAGMLFH